MNNIITMRRLVDIMAGQSGIPADQVERFLKAFTSLVAETIAEGGSVSINGVGEFSLAAGRRVAFRPDAQLAKDINSPFDIFQPEELATDITVEQLSRPVAEATEAAEAAKATEVGALAETMVEPATVEQTVTVDVPEPLPEPEPEPEPELEPEPEPEPEPELEPEPDPEPEPEIVAEPEHDPIAAVFAQKDEESDEYDGAYEDGGYDEDYQESKFPIFWTLIGLLVGLLLGVGIGFFMHDPIEKMLEPSLDAEHVAAVEAEEEDFDMMEPEMEVMTVEEGALEPAGEPVAAPAVASEPEKPASQPSATEASNVTYETVKPGTSLANLAKKHYGERSYWVYIYLENQNVIKNPNRVPQGTRLVIPPLEKYATQATQAEKLEAARKKVSEVLSKYPN